ncbi:MAG: HEAT repeat domain-containing protein [Gemmataceae bacterium]|nr:HEAT repeat domain-containing protein [Gemmataceae bacterium]
MRWYFLVMAPVILGLIPQPDVAQEKPIDAAQLAKKLMRQLSDSDPKVRADAARQMRELAQSLHACMHMLASRARSDPEPEVREHAFRALTFIGTGARIVVPELLKGLADPNENVRIAAVSFVGGSAPLSREAIPKLVQFVKDKNPVMRRRAIGALGRFGSEARVAIPALVFALDDPDKGVPGGETGVALWARINLRWIDPDAEHAGLALATIRRTDESKVRAEGFQPFEKDPPKASHLLPVFVQVLKDKDYPELRGPAAHALGLLGPAAAKAVPELVAALKRNDVKDETLALKHRSAIVWALGRIGPQAKAALTELSELRRNAPPQLREEVDAAVKQIQAGE